MKERNENSHTISSKYIDNTSQLYCITGHVYVIILLIPFGQLKKQDNNKLLNKNKTLICGLFHHIRVNSTEERFEKSMKPPQLNLKTPSGKVD